jgi:hypothetical protein
MDFHRTQILVTPRKRKRRLTTSSAELVSTKETSKGNGEVRIQMKPIQRKTAICYLIDQERICLLLLEELII